MTNPVMTNPGRPGKEEDWEPLENPVPHKRGIPHPEPVKVPEKAPKEVPVSQREPERDPVQV